MNNKERLMEISLIREIRRKLGNFSISNEAKALALKVINDYEYNLELDIQRSNNNKKLLDEEGLENNIELVDVFPDPNYPDYQELKKIYLNDDLNTYYIYLNEIIYNISNYNLSKNEEKVFFKSLKEYTKFLSKLYLIRKNNQENYPELFSDDGKNI